MAKFTQMGQSLSFKSQQLTFITLKVNRLYCVEEKINRKKKKKN